MRNATGLFVKFLFFSLFVFFLAMLYWSNLLQEKQLRDIQITLKEIKKSQRHPQASATNTLPPIQIDRPHIKKELPNLLEKDPYFTEYLPKKLKKRQVPQSTLRLSMISAVDNLLPFTPWGTINTWISYCQGTVARIHVANYERFTPDLAIKVEKRKGRDENHQEFWVHLREDINWQPLRREDFPESMRVSNHFFKNHPVTAHDFVFYWEAFANPHVDLPTAVTLRRLLFFIEDVRAVDDKTFVVEIKKVAPDGDENGEKHFPYAALSSIAFLKPLARFVYQHLPSGEKITPEDSNTHFYKKSSLWAQHFVRHFASRVIPSCGAWIFNGLSDESIRFRRNPDYHNPSRVLFENLEISLTSTEDAIFRDFIAQKSDTCTLSPKNTIEVKKYQATANYQKDKENDLTINHVDYFARIFSYLGWNQKRPFFENKKVRQALTYAIDRERIITQNLDNRAVVVTGPFSYKTEPYNDKITPYPYDPERARKLLEEAGWIDTGGDGIREKIIDGILTPFRFRLTYFVKNPVTKANCELIASFLEDVGVDCQLHGVDINDLSMATDEKKFDAIYLAWGAGVPPENPRQIWHSSGADQKGSSNAIGFKNKRADAIIDHLFYEDDKKKRIELYHEFCDILHDEAPYTFLFTTKVRLFYWNTLNNIFIPKDAFEDATVTEPNVMLSWKEKEFS